MIDLRTVDDLWKDCAAFVRSRLPNAVVSKASDIGARLYAFVEGVYGSHVNLIELQKDLFPSAESSSEALDGHASARLGESPRRGATTARGTSALRVSGTGGTVIPVGSTLFHSSGSRYQITAVENSGVVHVDFLFTDCSIESVTTGAAANLETGETLTFESAIAGLSSTATLVSDVTGGEDQESDSSLLNRLLDAFRSPQAGGRASDYRQWALSQTGVASAYVYQPHPGAPSGRRGLGVVEVVPLATGSGSDRAPSASIITLVDDEIEANRPGLAEHYVLGVTPDPEYVRVEITAKVGYEFDYVDPATEPTVSSYSSATSSLVISSVPSGMSAGDRVVIKGEQHTILTLNVGTKTLTFDPADFWASNPGAESVYSGGPLFQPIHDAILALFDSLGPAKGIYADPEQDWDDTLRVNAIIDAVMDVPGVRDVTVVTPAANVTPSILTSSPWTINLITPNVIYVEQL